MGCDVHGKQRFDLLLAQLPLALVLDRGLLEDHRGYGRRTAVAPAVNGGFSLFPAMVGAVAPYLASFQRYPNNDYSYVTRSN